MSLTNESKWTENFPPMSTERMFVTAVCTETVLIVAGGVGPNGRLATIEVLNFETNLWSTAANLPESLFCCSAAVLSDHLYMLGDGWGDKSVYACSVSALLQTCKQKSSLEKHISALSLSNIVWIKLPDLPVIGSTCVTFCGQLLAVGGVDSDHKHTTAVYMYNQATNSWNVISHMALARRNCFATVFTNEERLELMISRLI